MSEFQIVSIKLNNAAFKALRKSPAAQALVMNAAQKIAAQASAQSGESYEAHPSPGRNRARAVVVPMTADAARDSAENLTLIRSLNAAR